MKFLPKKNIIEALVPEFSKKEKKEMIAYFSVYDKYAEAFSEKATEDLKDHPDFGRIIKEIPEDISKARSKLSRSLQKDAILNDHWIPYIEYQIEQGINYAKMGLDFKAWYEVISMVKKFLTPHLYQEYGSGAKFFAAINGMNSFMDIAMSIIGEAYVQEKNIIIKRAHQRLLSIFETTADIIFVIEVEKDGSYRFTDVNKSYQKITGLAAHDVVGKHVHEIVPPESLNTILDKYQEAIKGKKIVRWEETSRYPRGLVTGEVSIAPIFNDEGRCTLLVGTTHDITERKKAEMEIKVLNEGLEQKVMERTAQLEQANNEMESFTYSVSHDLRAPLRAINGYAEMLKEDYETELDNEGKRIIGNISHNATKMGVLIDELLTFSRLGRQEIRKTKVKMDQLTEDVLNDLDKSYTHHAKINRNNLHEVNADYGLLRHVMFNLLSNAVKYSSKKKDPVVEISSKEDNGEIIFSVKDNGAGFDMSYADKLFGVFQRLHSEDEFEGTGVGLAIVQRLIDKHGGRVWAEGKIDEGATFYFSLINNQP